MILEHVPGARMHQYHGHLSDLPEKYRHLPVIGFVRNPWDWYVSMYFDYRRKQQYVYQIISAGGNAGFEETVSRFLRLGDMSDQSVKLLQQLSRIAPRVISTQIPPRRRLPGLRSKLRVIPMTAFRRSRMGRSVSNRPTSVFTMKIYMDLTITHSVPGKPTM